MCSYNDVALSDASSARRFATSVSGQRLRDIRRNSLSQILPWKDAIMDKRQFLAATASIAGLTVLNVACTTTTGGSADPADQRREIDAAADASLSRLYDQVRDSREP